MKKSTFFIFLLIILGLVENVSVEEIKVKSSSIGLARKRDLAAVGDDIDDGLTELTEKIERLEQKISELQNENHGALSALSDQLTNQKEEIKEIKSAQKQFSKAMTFVMETLTTLNFKMDTWFPKSMRDQIQLDKRIERTEALGQELLTIANVSTCYTRIPAVDCKTLLNNRCTQTHNGVYRIRHYTKDLNTTLQVFCDMEDDDGGWTVIQRRGVRDIPKAQRESFNRRWTEYENGFGSANDDYWIGLKLIHILTRDCENELKVTLTHWNGNHLYGKYSNFQISGKEDDYRLTIGNFTAGTLDHITIKHMDYNSGMKFSTFDKDNDKWNEGNCAKLFGRAWWHNHCSYVALNGEYAEDESNGRVTDEYTGIHWYPDWKYYSFKKTEMKIRSKC